MSAKTLSVAAVLLLCVLSAILPLWITGRAGPGISDDAVVYLTGARAIREGRGYVSIGRADGVRPVTQFPPMYPAVLATISPGDPATASRWLTAFLSAASIVLFGTMIFRANPGRPWAAPVAVFLLASAVEWPRAHSMAWSEPLFLFLVLISSIALQRPGARVAWGWIVFSAVAAGAATMTRFAGAAWIAAACVWLLLRGGKGAIERLARPLVFGVVASIPMAAWLASNITRGGGASSREAGFYPLQLLFIKAGVVSIAEWLAPSRTPNALQAAIVLGAILAMAIAVYLTRGRRSEDTPAERLSRAVAEPMALFVFFYGAMLTLGAVGSNLPPTPESRIMLPAYVAALAALFSSVERFAPLARSRHARCVLWGVAAYFLIWRVAILAFWAPQSREGIGYARDLWTKSQTLAHVRELPAGETVFTNAIFPVYYHTGVAAREIPSDLVVDSTAKNPDFDRDIAEFLSESKRAPTHVVILNNVKYFWVLGEARLAELAKLRLTGEYEDGAIYRSIAE